MRSCSAVGLWALVWVVAVRSQQLHQNFPLQQTAHSSYNLPVQQQIFRDPNTGKYIIYRNNVTIVHNGQRVGSSGGVSVNGGGDATLMNGGGAASSGSLNNGGISRTGSASVGNPAGMRPQLMAFDLTGLGVEIRQDPVAHIRVTIVQPGQTGSTIPEAGENAPVTGQNITGMYVRKEANMTMGVSADNLLLVGTVVPTSVGGQSYFIPFIRETEIICEGRFHKVEYVGNSTESVHSLIPLFQIAQNQYSTREGIVGGETVLLFPDYFKTPNPPGCEASTTLSPNGQQPQNNIDQLINEGVAVVKFYKRPRPHFKVSSSYIVGTSGFFVSTTSTFPVVGGELQITGTKTAATGESEYFTVDRRGPDSDDYIQLPVTRTPDGKYQVMVPLTEPASTQPTAPVENTPVDGVPAVVVPNAKLPDDPNSPNSNNDNAVMLFIDGEPNLRAKPLTGAEPKPNENGFVIPRLDEYPIQMNSYGIPALTFSGHQWRQSDQGYYLLTTRKPADKEYGQPTETAYGRVVYLELKTISPTEQQVQVPLSDGYSQQQQYRPRIQNDGPTTKIIIADYRGNSNPNNTTPPSGGGGDLDGLVDSGQAGVKVWKHPKPHIIYSNGPNGAGSPGNGSPGTGVPNPGLGLYSPKDSTFPVVMENGVPTMRIPGRKQPNSGDIYIPVEKIQPPRDADDWYYAPVRRDGNGGYTISVPLNSNANGQPLYGPIYEVIDGNTVIVINDALVPGSNGGGPISGGGGMDVELRLDPNGAYLRTLPLNGTESTLPEQGVVIANSPQYPVVTNGLGTPQLTFKGYPWRAGNPGLLLITTQKPAGVDYYVPTSDQNGPVVYFPLTALADGGKQLEIPLTDAYRNQNSYTPAIEDLYGFRRIVIRDYRSQPNNGTSPGTGGDDLDSLVDAGIAGVRIYKRPFHIKYSDQPTAGTIGLYVPKNPSFPVVSAIFKNSAIFGMGGFVLQIPGHKTANPGDAYIVVERVEEMVWKASHADSYYFAPVARIGDGYAILPSVRLLIMNLPSLSVEYDRVDGGPAIVLFGIASALVNGAPDHTSVVGTAIALHLLPDPYINTIALSGSEAAAPADGIVLPNMELYPILNYPPDGSLQSGNMTPPLLYFEGYSWRPQLTGLLAVLTQKPADVSFFVETGSPDDPVIYYPVISSAGWDIFSVMFPLNTSFASQTQYRPPKESAPPYTRVYIKDLRDYAPSAPLPSRQPWPQGVPRACPQFYLFSGFHYFDIPPGCAFLGGMAAHDCRYSIRCAFPTEHMTDGRSVVNVRCSNGAWFDDDLEQPMMLPYCVNPLFNFECPILNALNTHEASIEEERCLGNQRVRTANLCYGTYGCRVGTVFADYSPSPVRQQCVNGVFHEGDQIAVFKTCTDHCPALHESVEIVADDHCPLQRLNRHAPHCKMSIRCKRGRKPHANFPNNNITCAGGVWRLGGEGGTAVSDYLQCD